MRAAAVIPLAALLALTSARSDHDFEFDDTPEAETRRPRRYVYDPHSEVCRSLVCKKREVCLLRDSYTAFCANKKDILRRGDVIVSAVGTGGGPDDEDVFYESRALPDQPEVLDFPVPSAKNERCVGCSGVSRGGFLCGSDNRTYSSLCRLDLHNCVHRPRSPVRLACAGFCPCPRHSGDETARIPVPRPHRTRQRSDEQERRRRRLEMRTNEVMLPRRRPSAPPQTCALDKMADRLLDWFSVLMEQAGATPPPPHGFGADCKPEVRWMFRHLDSAGDGLLQPDDLYALSHDERERCLRPFLARCGLGAGGIGRAAWCGCLRGASRPCAAWARAARGRGRGAYVPACDARGFYRPRQCHAALAVCWCVDAHGQELPGSRTKGAPSCPGEVEEGDESAGGAPADDEDEGGSGDREPDLRY
ncbi:proteoglycan Cow isoform X1 [Pieris rapae]|uniref:proteoglycan Cow isoform X1 n=1 Tax=Pieris rapae TaxID=64459 RepID=UPI001E280A97|nr:proteoglycan Cow isoform X1 [Pieris rapae]